MFRSTIAICTSITVLIASCTDTHSTQPKNKCADTDCLAPEEPPAGQAQLSSEDQVSIAAEECLWCLGSASEACFDEAQDCIQSFSCQAWKECNETCVTHDLDETCYESCDAPMQEFFTPEKMKSCSCEVCYAQCINMCPL